LQVDAFLLGQTNTIAWLRVANIILIPIVVLRELLVGFDANSR